MGHGWIKRRFLREEVGPGVRYTGVAGAVVRGQRLVKRDGNGDWIEAGDGDLNVAGMHVSEDQVASAEDLVVALSGVVSGTPDVAISKGDLLKAYADGKVGPFVDATKAGTDMSAGGQTGAGFTNQPTNDGVEVVSDSTADTTQTLVLYGTTTGTTTLVKEEIVLNGTTPVSTTKVDWGEILGVEIKTGSPASAGTVTVREASGDLTITTLAAGVRRSGIYLIQPADQNAYNTIPDIVADGATTKIVGIVATDAAGVEQLQAVAAAGATLVSFAAASRTITKLLLGDVEGTRDITLTVDAHEDNGELLVGRALADASASATSVSLLLELPGLSDGSVGLDALSEEIEAAVTVTISSAELLALNATPIELVPAPGAGKALIFLGAQFHLDFNAAAYDGIAAGEDLAIKYTDASGAQVAELETTGFLDDTADAYRWAYPADNLGAALPSVEPVANAPLVAHLLVGEIATGDSPVHVRVFYRVVNLDLSV